MYDLLSPEGWAMMTCAGDWGALCVYMVDGRFVVEVEALSSNIGKTTGLLRRWLGSIK